MSTDDELATDDLVAAVLKIESHGIKPTFRTFEEVDAYDEMAAPGGAGQVMFFEIGRRGGLTPQKARISGMAFAKMMARWPECRPMTHVSGYDNDPRELWDIPEVCAFTQRWAKYAGIDHIEAALAAKLPPVCIGALAKCGAFRDVDPATVPITGGAAA